LLLAAQAFAKPKSHSLRRGGLRWSKMVLSNFRSLKVHVRARGRQEGGREDSVQVSCAVMLRCAVLCWVCSSCRDECQLRPLCLESKRAKGEQAQPSCVWVLVVVGAGRVAVVQDGVIQLQVPVGFMKASGREEMCAGELCCAVSCVSAPVCHMVVAELHCPFSCRASNSSTHETPSPGTRTVKLHTHLCATWLLWQNCTAQMSCLKKKLASSSSRHSPPRDSRVSRRFVTYATMLPPEQSTKQAAQEVVTTRDSQYQKE
jgi:hypothetical protein